MVDIYDNLWIHSTIIIMFFSWSLPQFETMIDANDAMNEDAYIVRDYV